MSSDSLKTNKTLNSNLTIQISQIYSAINNTLTVEIPDTQKQNNSSDCGVFSIAFLTDILYSNFKIDTSNIRFNIPEMRPHLISCIENNKIVPFPKAKMPKMPCNQPKTVRVKVYCTCELPEFVDNMIKCDNYRCKVKCFHKKCVNNYPLVQGVKWLCHYCTW